MHRLERSSLPLRLTADIRFNRQERPMLRKTPRGSAGAAASATSPPRSCSGVRTVAVAVALRTAALLVASATLVGAASAQAPSGILAPGNAIVTGFSGTKAPGAVPPGVDPADLTEIDLSGPSARIVDLQAPGAPAQAQLINAPKPFT